MKKEINKKNTKKKSHKLFWSIFSFFFIAVLVGMFFFFQYVVEGLPSLEQLENPKQSLASEVYSADGVLIGKFFTQNRVHTDIDSIPKHVIHAFLDSEDKKYYTHWGVDLERVVKAVVKTIFLNQRQGASTITQQLAKNLYKLRIKDETFFDTIVRKFREWITAVRIERNYTKDEILEMYLNESYFGRGAYGVAMAAEVFFDKKVSDLKVEESAILVGLNNLPGRYDPYSKYQNAFRKRNIVMSEMVEDGHLAKEEYEKLKTQPIELAERKTKANSQSIMAPYFIEHVRNKLQSMSQKYGYNLYEDGLTIYTTLDTRMQKLAEKSAEEHLSDFQEKFDGLWNWNKHRKLLDEYLDRAIRNRRSYINAATKEEKTSIYNRLKKNTAFVDSVQHVVQRIEVAFTVLDVSTGNIKVMVGGRDIKNGRGLNHCTQIKRQPGSSFKPIVYTVALDNGLYPAYPILNQPFDYEGWQPMNFSRDNVGGFLTLREGITNSINLVAARLIIEGHAQLWQVDQYAHKMGITSKLQPYPAISLGASEVIPMDLVSVYATIANRGIYNEPLAITRIEDKDGIVIDSFAPKTREAISEETAYMITDLMKSVVQDGTAKRVKWLHHFNAECAGKTGTNGDYKDAWFMGFTPILAGGVWVGFNDQRISFTGSWGQGAKAAIPIWANFMREAYDSLGLPDSSFQKPKSENVVPVTFCKNTIYDLGTPRLASKYCDGGTLTDIINIKDIPPAYNPERDNKIKFFDRYAYVDSLAHEAVEIVE